MFRRFYVCCTGSVLLAGALYAGEKWSRMNFGALTPVQAQRVLNDSPWAKQASASIMTPKREPRPEDVPMPAPANQPPQAPSYASDGYGVNDGSWDGGVGRSRAYDPPKVPVLVRWDSAVPVREALLETNDPDRRDTPNTVSKPERDYIVTVIGLVPAQKTNAITDEDEEHPQTPAEREEARRAQVNAVRQGVLDSTRLLRPGKKPIAPEDVHLDASGTLKIFFPKTDPIEPDDKEVIFDSRYGALHVSQPFRLKDMMVNGQLAL